MISKVGVVGILAYSAPRLALLRLHQRRPSEAVAGTATYGNHPLGDSPEGVKGRTRTRRGFVGVPDFGRSHPETQTG